MDLIDCHYTYIQFFPARISPWHRDQSCVEVDTDTQETTGGRPAVRVETVPY